MTIESEKSNLRKIFKAKRAALTQSEIKEKSAQISKNFIENLLPKILPQNSNKVFAIYLSSYNEVDTSEIISYFKKHKIKFCHPKIIAKNQPLEFIAAAENQKFAANIFFPKLLEPQDGEKISPDFIILPLLAFDKNLIRLGMGGGFFDRTIESLKKQKTEIKAIALAYEFQRADGMLPNEKTDQSLDAIVTEKNLFLRS